MSQLSSLEYRASWAEQIEDPEDSDGWKTYESKKHRQIRRKQEKTMEKLSQLSNENYTYRGRSS